MKKLFLLILLLASLSIYSEKSKVYFTSEISAEGVMKVFSFIDDSVNGKVGVKVHFGEEGNQNFLKPSLVKELVLSLDASFVETNVLYKSKRQQTQTHIQLAKEHGFTFAPIDIMDSEGTLILKNDDPLYFREINVGSHIDDYDCFVIYSHFKGHGSAGFGGAIKNVAMGFGTPEAKRDMHSAFLPVTVPEKCINCARCADNCPADAIVLKPVVIDPSDCIGCGKCISECPVQAIINPTKNQSRQIFLEKLVEYARVISEYKPMVYINVLANIAPACDCVSSAGKPFMDDIGILASTDIVAIEKASHDLLDKAHNCDDVFLAEIRVSGKHQIEYAEMLNMGSSDYELINIDNLPEEASD